MEPYLEALVSSEEEEAEEMPPPEGEALSRVFYYLADYKSKREC